MDPGTSVFWNEVELAGCIGHCDDLMAEARAIQHDLSTDVDMDDDDEWADYVSAMDLIADQMQRLESLRESFARDLRGAG